MRQPAPERGSNAFNDQSKRQTVNQELLLDTSFTFHLVPGYILGGFLLSHFGLLSADLATFLITKCIHEWSRILIPNLNKD